jgi:hypothetical protein
VTNDGLSVKSEDATAKYWFGIVLMAFSENKALSMLNTDQLYHLTHCWYGTHTCPSSQSVTLTPLITGDK